jgi:hypothetical protein
MDAVLGTSRLAVVCGVFCLGLTSSLVAEPVPPDRARDAADACLRGLVRRSPGIRPAISIATEERGAWPPAVTGLQEIRDDDGTILAYVADLNPRGFITISADTDVVPIVAYSLRNPFPRDTGQNPLCRMLKEDMKRRREALAQGLAGRTLENNLRWDVLAAQADGPVLNETFQQWPPEGTTATGGWLETMWDQHPPYNAFCPLDPIDGNRSYVGCVATAFAQIVNYHRECNIRLVPADAYTTEHGIDVDAEGARYDFPSFTELNAYLTAIQAKYATGTELDATDIAALSFACGVAVQMDYSSDGSGAHTETIADVLSRRFDFYSADVAGGVSCELYPVLQENLVNGLPALLTIREPNASRGHAIVCDGYNTDGEYHLNFGWGTERPDAMTEAWYRLPIDMPSFLNILVGAILNIRPEAPGVTAEPVQLHFDSPPGQVSEAQTLRIRKNRPDTVITAIHSCEGFLIADVNEVAYSDHIGFVETNPSKQEVLICVRFCPDRPAGYQGILRVDYDGDQTTYVILTGDSHIGGTEVPGGEVTGHWEEAGSPYFILGDITVPRDGLLIIDAGAQIRFGGPHSMTIGPKARLLALGNSAHPVEFTAWNRREGWKGLRFLESGNDDILRHCVIAYAKKGSGITVDDPNDSEEEVLEEGRDPNACGGAIYCRGSDPTIMNCKIANNAGDVGGAVYCYDSRPAISNTVLANNLATGGTPQCGGVYAEIDSLPELTNCTIVNNSPGGIFSASWEGMTVTNTIVWGNNKYQIEVYESTPTVTFCDIQGGFPGEGNIDADPCCFAPSSGVGLDYDGTTAIWTLGHRSPCINAGTPAALPKTDLAGNLRIAHEIPDLGAYENQSELPLVTIAPSTTIDAGYVPVGSSSIAPLEIRNTGPVAVRIESLGISDANSAFSLLAVVQDRVLMPGESLAVEVAFLPATEGVFTGTLRIDSTASNGATKAVTLRGVGVSGAVVPAGPIGGTWMKAQSPFVVTGDVFVPIGHSLTIEPGATIKFAGHFSLTVGYRGTLTARGTQEEGIVFTAVDPQEGWFGLRFVNSEDDDVLQYCTVEYARKPRSSGGGYLNLMGGAILCCGSRDVAPGFPLPSSPKIDHCVIANNEAEFGGGIMLTDSSDAWVTHCAIVGNSCKTYGGAIFIYGAYGVIANNVIAHNSGYLSGGIANWYALPLIVNNTIVHNRPNGLYLEATEMSQWGSVPIVNNILWHNEMYVEESVWPSEYIIRFNDIQGGWRGHGNLDVDPLFADPNNWDYHLKSQAGRWDPVTGAWATDDTTSPCIDAGDPDSPVAQEPIPHGQRLNMGAYGGTAEASKSP